MIFTISDYPWKHLIIDDLLNTDVFEEIEQYATKFNNSTTHVLENHSILIKSRMYDLLSPIILTLKNEYYDLLNFGGKRLPEKYYPYIQFNVCPPGYAWPKIHVDAPRKLMTTVLYINPSDSNGTDLYTEESSKSWVKSVTWKKNRSVSFVSQEDSSLQQTWHNYKNIGDTNRISVNLILCSNVNGKYY